MSCGADTVGGNLHDTLGSSGQTAVTPANLDGSAYTLPSRVGNPLYAEIEKLTTADLTEKVVDGNGVFDALMTSNKAHLRGEFEAGRITSDQYAKAYIELSMGAMSSAVQFLLSRDQVAYQSMLAQAQARQAEADALTAAVNLERSKVDYASQMAQLDTLHGQVALGKMQLSIADVDYCLKKEQHTQAQYQTSNMLPAQLEQLQKQTDLVEEQISRENYQTTSILPAELDQLQKQTNLLDEQYTQQQYTTEFMMPAQLDQIQKQTELVEEQISTAEYNLTYLYPEQVRDVTKAADIKAYQVDTMLPTQRELVQEQVEAKHAETADMRTDGRAQVRGMIGKQKELYDQQIDSYQKDAAYKVGKLYSDGWITQKTLDEGLTAPDSYTNVTVDSVLSDLRAGVGLGTTPS